MNIDEPIYQHVKAIEVLHFVEILLSTMPLKRTRMGNALYDLTDEVVRLRRGSEINGC